MTRHRLSLGEVSSNYKWGDSRVFPLYQFTCFRCFILVTKTNCLVTNATVYLIKQHQVVYKRTLMPVRLMTRSVCVTDALCRRKLQIMCEQWWRVQSVMLYCGARPLLSHCQPDHKASVSRNLYCVTWLTVSLFLQTDILLPSPCSVP